VIQSCNFFLFLKEGEYFCLAICPIIRLYSINLVTRIISIRVETNFVPAFSGINFWLASVICYCHLLR